MIIKKIMTTTALSTLLLIAGLPSAQSAEKSGQDQNATTKTTTSPATSAAIQLIPEEVLNKRFELLKDTGYDLGVPLRQDECSPRLLLGSYDKSPHSLFIVLSSDPGSLSIAESIFFFRTFFHGYKFIVLGTLEALDNWSRSGGREEGVGYLHPNRTEKYFTEDNSLAKAAKIWKRTLNAKPSEAK